MRVLGSVGSSCLDFSSSSSSFTSLVWTGMDLGGGFFLRAGAVEGRLTARGGMFAWREREEEDLMLKPHEEMRSPSEWFTVAGLE